MLERAGLSWECRQSGLLRQPLLLPYAAICLSHGLWMKSVPTW